MSENDWKQQVRNWILKRNNSTPDLAEAFVQFFAQAFEKTRCPDQAWFGTHRSFVSLVVGGIFLAAVSSSGDIWLLADEVLPPVEGLDYRPVRSTKNSKTPLVWIHAREFNDVTTINNESQIWRSYELASRKILNSPIATSRNDVFQESRGKKKLSVLWQPLRVDMITFPDEVSSTQVFGEGSVRQVTVNAYERSSEARSLCIAYYEARCFICKLDFAAVYGKAVEGFIHVHHLRQLSEIGAQYEVNAIEDLRPVCPNCHAVIHSRRNDPYSIEEVRAMILAAKNSGD
jgi:hypothetical protein